MPTSVPPGEIPAISPVHGSRAPTTVASSNGKATPSNGSKLPFSATAAAVSSASASAATQSALRVAAQQPAKAELKRISSSNDLASLATHLGQFLRESGRAISFRVQDSAGKTVVQEVDPDSGAVIAEISPDDLLSLAKGLGLSGLVVNTSA